MATHQLSHHLRFLITGTVVLLGLVGISGCTSPSPPTTAPFARPVYPPAPEQGRFEYETTLRSSAQIHRETEQERFRRRAFGKALTDQRPIKPLDIASRFGKIFVTDTMAGVVHAFDIARRRFFSFGFRKRGELVKPAGIEFSDARRIYVADPMQSVIRVYDELGLHMHDIGLDIIRKPLAVAVDDTNERIYVVDNGGVESRRHLISVFHTDGEHLHEFGSRGGGPGEFNLPTDIAVSGSGRVYVLDAGNFRIQVFSPDGEYLFEFGKVGRNFGEFSRPRFLAMDQADNVYVSDASFGNVQIFNAEGKLLMSMGGNGPEDRPGRYALIAGLDIDETGRLYVIDQIYRKIDIYRRLDQLTPAYSLP